MIPFTDFGGAGRELHFLHANGYPPACYLPLIKRLSARCHVQGMHLRPLWPGQQPKSLNNWKPLTDDLLRFLDERGLQQVIGFGHSIGAIVTLRAALRQPERFRALVLVDPVLFLPSVILLWGLIMRLGLGYQAHPLVGTALRRRRAFDDLDAVFRGYRRREVFRFMDDESLRAYVNGVVKPRPGGGYELAYSPEWEARIYVTGVKSDLDLWRGLPTLKMPILFLRGAETDTFLERTSRKVTRIRPQTEMVTVENSSHLLPLERPERVAELTLDFLQEAP